MRDFSKSEVPREMARGSKSRMLVVSTVRNSITRFKEARVLRAARRGKERVLFGYYIKKNFRLIAPVISPGRPFVTINFANSEYGKERMYCLAEKIFFEIDRNKVQIVVRGLTDEVRMGIRLDTIFSSVLRASEGLLPVASPNGMCTSFIVTRKGHFADGRYPSSIEDGLNTLQSGYGTTDPTAAALVKKVLSNRLTRYQFSLTDDIRLANGSVLIVGQYKDTKSNVIHGIAKTDEELIDYIMKCQPIENVSKYYYKPHPLVSYNEQIHNIKDKWPTITVLPQHLNIFQLLEQLPRVATIDSNVGLEAALSGCEVHCFGVPFYSNWGFTVDHMVLSRRRNKLQAEDVAAFVWKDCTHYLDPITKQPISALKALGVDE